MKRPTTNKAELHLTLTCDLDCIGCNRASWLQKPHTPNMTLDDAREFFRQADELNWRPIIIIIGGEPTLHPDFMEFCKIGREWTDGEILMFSNAHRPEARELIDKARLDYSASIEGATWKPGGTVHTIEDKKARDWTDDVYLSPHDHGLPQRLPCFAHCTEICGISIDHEGYSPCAMGGAIDALLGLGVRTKRLADLFEPVKLQEITEALCKHCGWRYQYMFERATDDPGVEERFGVQMSKTWLAAFKDRK